MSQGSSIPNLGRIWPAVSKKKSFKEIANDNDNDNDNDDNDDNAASSQ